MVSSCDMGGRLSAVPRSAKKLSFYVLQLFRRECVIYLETGGFTAGGEAFRNRDGNLLVPESRHDARVGEYGTSDGFFACPFGEHQFPCFGDFEIGGDDGSEDDAGGK